MWWFLLVVCWVPACAGMTASAGMTVVGQEHVASKGAPAKAISVQEKIDAGRVVAVELLEKMNTRKPAAKSVTVTSEVQNDVPMILATAAMPDDKNVRLSLKWKQTLDGIKLVGISIDCDTKGVTDETRLAKQIAKLRPWAEKLGQQYLNEQDQKALLETFDKQAEYSAKTKGMRAIQVGTFEASVGHLGKSVFVGLAVK